MSQLSPPVPEHTTTAAEQCCRVRTREESSVARDLLNALHSVDGSQRGSTHRVLRGSGFRNGRQCAWRLGTRSRASTRIRLVRSRRLAGSRSWSFPLRGKRLFARWWRHLSGARPVPSMRRSIPFLSTPRFFSSSAREDHGNRRPEELHAPGNRFLCSSELTSYSKTCVMPC